MEVTEAELAKQYAEMEDEAVLGIAAQRLHLTEGAQRLLVDEVNRRGLSLPEAEALPPEVALAYESWVTIDRFGDVSAGIIARSALEAAGIACYLPDENTVRMDWQMLNFIGGMRLQVREGDAAEAKAALEGLAMEEPPEGDAVCELEGDQCPRCGSAAIHRRPKFGILSLVSVLWLGIPAPQGRRRWVCDHCGNEWADSA